MHNFPQHLLDGHANFMSGRYAREKERIRDLAEAGQTPTTLIIACCDSRAAPEMIFDAGPGELFVLRNVANLVPTYQPDGGQHGTSAAIEFAIKGLHIDLCYDEDNFVDWWKWIDVYLLTPVPPRGQIKYILPSYPKER